MRQLEAIPVALALALLVLTLAAPDVAAKGPPLAETTMGVDVLAAPALDAQVLGSLAGGTEVELTGAAAPGYLEIVYGNQTAWIPSQYLSLGLRPGIDTAVTTIDTPLLDAPMPDATVLATVQQGETVILTGARLDGYDAAAHAGVGGWIDEGDLAR
jgi:uncharacterized protein YgiM (DUF1202 family)